MPDTQERDLQELIDRSRIQQLMQRYGRGLDRMDVDLVRSCYFDEAIDDHDSFIGGPDAFIVWANRCSAEFVAHHHGVMNHHCELDGDDAYCETYYLFIGVAPAAPHLMSMGRYVDHLQKRDGEWRIACRVVVIEKNFALADADPALAAGLATLPPQTATRDRRDVSYHRPPIARSGPAMPKDLE